MKLVIATGDYTHTRLLKNREVLEAFGAAMHAQGLTGRPLSPEEVFTIA